ncbi:MAG: DUF3764 family protein [Bacteroidota bacterium]|nr:DUF3764 family protein [Bacteroidota bacterium]
MVTVILTHEVKNFSEWKRAFDADDSNRQQAGVKINGVYNSIDNPNVVTIISEFPSAEALSGMMSNPDMKATMEAAGVIGVPEAKILNKL